MTHQHEDGQPLARRGSNPSPTDAPEIDEPLVESAPLAHSAAPTLCAVDAATGETCAWYHGFWQYLRAMRLAPTLSGQGDFLLETLRPLARAGNAGRVLISGSADYSLAAHVLRAYDPHGRALQLSVIDRCETPLYLTRWYAERQRRAVSTARRNALDHDRGASVDVIVANSFLGYFDEATRPRLYAAWARLLRPGGALVFSNRLRPAAGPGLTGFTPEEARGFVDTVRAEAERWRGGFNFDPEQVAEWARVYADRFRSHPVRSAGEVASALGEAGFAVDRVEVAAAVGRAGGVPLAGPSLSTPAEHLRVVATRR